MEINKKLLDRFIGYTKIWTTSVQEQADAGVIPSSPRETEFAKVLADELRSIGISDVTISPHSYVCARLPASAGCESVPSIGLLAHMDTAPDVSGQNVNPQVVENYDGRVLTLKDGIVLDPAKDKYLACAGKNRETIITTDGTTLLGADDKAGIAVIMTALEELIAHPEKKHGQIEVIFSPDEETGHGMDKVPVDWIQSKQCYTLDGGHVCELEAECFNAYKSEISFEGVAMHTGTARPGMVNGSVMAASFVSMLPRHEAPETTDGYQGFYAVMYMEGNIEKASVTLYVRDFTAEGMKKRLETIEMIAKTVETVNKGSKVSVKHTKQYLNMKEELDKNPAVLDKLVKAVESVGLEPYFSAIRGGTDGSRLTEMGIPTPNVFTGGHNFHSRYEWASLDQMTAAQKTVVALAELWTE